MSDLVEKINYDRNIRFRTCQKLFQQCKICHVLVKNKISVKIDNRIVDVYDKLEDTKLKKTLNEVDFATSTFIEYLQLQKFSENKRRHVFYTSKVGRK